MRKSKWLTLLGFNLLFYYLASWQPASTNAIDQEMYGQERKKGFIPTIFKHFLLLKYAAVLIGTQGDGENRNLNIYLLSIKHCLFDILLYSSHLITIFSSLNTHLFIQYQVPFCCTVTYKVTAVTQVGTWHPLVQSSMCIETRQSQEPQHIFLLQAFCGLVLLHFSSLSKGREKRHHFLPKEGCLRCTWPMG